MRMHLAQPRRRAAAALVAALAFVYTAQALAQGPDLAARSRAADATAKNAAFCRTLGDFYWEIGNAQGPQASGQIGSSYSADKTISIASASKFVWGAYVVQRSSANGGPTPQQVQALEMRTGLTQFNPIWCMLSRSVEACASNRDNGVLVQQNVGRFYYGGGHDQRLAIDLGLGRASAADMTAEVRRVLGPELGFGYERPQPAGGMESSPAQFGQFLRKIISGQLAMKQYLGYQPVCTQPSSCPTAVSSPVPEAWHYSLNHWVEDAPGIGDGAFSSPGLEGFYPWISADKSTYGIVARQKLGLRAYWESVQCGRTIRRAWMSGQPQS